MKFILALSLLLSSLAFGQQPSRAAITSAVGATYVGTNPEVGGSTPFQLTVLHKRHQVINPSGAITVKLPSVGVLAGDTWRITNRSTNKVTIQDSAAFYLNEITYGTIELVSLVATPTGTGTWLVTHANSQWSNWTPTGLWDNTTYTGRRKRVDDTAELEVKLALTGTPTQAGSVYVGIPSGLTIDANKINSQATYINILGRSVFFNGISNQTVTDVNYYDTGNIQFVYFGANGAYSNTASKTAPLTMAAGGNVCFNARLPITEWKMNP